MGWKRVKEHYRISHLVAVYPEKGICIGSPYIHDIIQLNPQTKAIATSRSGNPPGFSNDDLARYWAEIHADLGKLWALIEEPDVFQRDLEVFTCEGGTVVKYLCEEYGWPNATHDGQMMYNNVFFQTHRAALKNGIEGTKARIENFKDIVDRKQSELEKYLAHLSQARADLSSLENAN